MTTSISAYFDLDSLAFDFDGFVRGQPAAARPFYDALRQTLLFESLLGQLAEGRLLFDSGALQLSACSEGGSEGSAIWQVEPGLSADTSYAPPVVSEGLREKVGLTYHMEQSILFWRQIWYYRACFSTGGEVRF